MIFIYLLKGVIGLFIERSDWFIYLLKGVIG